MSGRRAAAPRKQYDRDYFDRWYRDPRTRVHVKAAVERKIRFAVGAAEYLNGQPIRRVLDAGCGEGPWQPILKRMRPGLAYQGVDSSAYSVARYGKSRNVVLGTFGRLGRLGLRGPYDLVVCADVLHYVPTSELKPGLKAIASLLEGTAFIEVFTSHDSIMGDMREMKSRAPDTYRKIFRAAGLVHCGMCCFVREDFAPGVTAFERGWE